MYWIDHMSCIAVIQMLKPIIYTMLGISIICVIISLIIKGHFSGMRDETYETFTHWAFILMLIISIMQVIIINI